MKYCSNCGANVEGMKFCPNCGSAIGETEAMQQEYLEIQEQTLTGQNIHPANMPDTEERAFYKQPAFILAIAIPVILAIVFVISAQIPSDGIGPRSFSKDSSAYIISTACDIAKEKGSFYDPDSLQFDNEEVLGTDEYGRSIVSMEINAKNAFGTYLGPKKYCIIFRISEDGKSYYVNRFAVESYYLLMGGPKGDGDANLDGQVNEEDIEYAWNLTHSDDNKWGEAPPQ